MLGHRGDHDIATAQPQPVGQVIDGLGRIAADDRDIAGISAAPADAATEVRNAAQWKLSCRGGEGAFRETVERLLRERGDWQTILKDFESGKSQGPGA